jgi:hypothetical protein
MAITNYNNLFDLLGTSCLPISAVSAVVLQKSQKKYALYATAYKLFATEDPEHWSSNANLAQKFSLQSAQQLATVYEIYGDLGKIAVLETD